MSVSKLKSRFSDFFGFDQVSVSQFRLYYFSGRYLMASIERMCWCENKPVNIRSAVTMSTTMTSSPTAILAAKSLLHAVHYSIEISQALLQERFTSKWWLSSKVETWNFAKYKLLKIANLMKIDFLFPSSNLNTIVQETDARQMHVSWTTLALKTRGINYVNVQTWLLFAPPSKFLATRLYMFLCDTGKTKLIVKSWIKN